MPRSSDSLATRPLHRLRAARDHLMVRRWSARCASPLASACWRGRRRRYNRRRYSRVSGSRLHSGIGLEPGQAIGGLAARIIFAADKALVAEPIKLGEQIRIVELLAIRLVA